MKKSIMKALLLGLSIFSLVGCGTKENNNASSNGSDSNNETNSNGVDQFAEVKKGETVAELVVKDFGTIYIRFFENEAPKAVENFITHAKNGYYDGLTFHRVMNEFMIQGGDPNGIGNGGESIWNEDFEDEFNENLQPVRGALCMANAGPNTNGSQFFIVQTGETYDSATLDAYGKQMGVEYNDVAKKAYAEVGGTPWLYNAHTVFGQVYEGLDVVDAIAATKTGANDKPVDDVIIEKINIVEYK